MEASATKQFGQNTVSLFGHDFDLCGLLFLHYLTLEKTKNTSQTSDFIQNFENVNWIFFIECNKHVTKIKEDLFHSNWRLLEIFPTYLPREEEAALSLRSIFLSVLPNAGLNTENSESLLSTLLYFYRNHFIQ